MPAGPLPHGNSSVMGMEPLLRVEGQVFSLHRGCIQTRPAPSARKHCKHQRQGSSVAPNTVMNKHHPPDVTHVLTEMKYRQTRTCFHLALHGGSVPLTTGQAHTHLSHLPSRTTGLQGSPRTQLFCFPQVQIISAVFQNKFILFISNSPSRSPWIFSA